jgi:Lrp/AsnC family transcriptional regulator for asnA, asnC and gidA
MGKIDETDMRILAELVKDAGLSVPKLSRKINVNPSVVYSRIKRLTKRSLIRRFTVEVNEEMLGYTVTAIIGLNIDSKLRESILEELLDLHEVREVSEVTGRFDLVATVKARSLDELHDVVSGKIGRVNGVLHTETFIQMKKKAKEPRYSLPA